MPPGKRVYAIGDIHGCATLLDQLHLKIEDDLAGAPPADTMLIYLGDYVDRGPDSAGVIERLSRPAPPGITRVFLKGNHEAMLEMFLEDPVQSESWCRVGGFETLMSYRINVNATLQTGGYKALGAELMMHMPLAHRQFLYRLAPGGYGVGDYFFCHAGIRPNIAIDRQTPHDLMWIKHEFTSSTADHGKIIVHGHSAQEAPEVRQNRINIDTGAYATGKLTALVLEGAERRFLSTT